MRVAFVVYPDFTALDLVKVAPAPRGGRTRCHAHTPPTAAAARRPRGGRSPAAAEVECQAMDGSQIPGCDHITVR